MPSQWNQMPPELVLMIMDTIMPDITHSNLCALLPFLSTCRHFRDEGLQKLYRAVALRHPYMLVWAAETNNLRVLAHLLDVGLDPDTVYWPPKYVAGERVGWLKRCCQAYGPQYFHPVRDVPHRQEMHQPSYIFRNFYMIPDKVLQRAMVEILAPDLKTWCKKAAHRGGHPFLASATLKGSYESYLEDIRYEDADSDTDSDADSPDWWGLQERGGNTTFVSALHRAAAHGHVEAMRLLLEHRATLDIVAPTQCGCKQLDVREDFRRDGCPRFQLYPESGDAVELYNGRRWADPRGIRGIGFQWTALHLAICRGQLQSVIFLLNQKAEHFDEYRRGLPLWQSVLHHAAAFSPLSAGIVPHLLAMPEFRNLVYTGESTYGLTPLWTAYLAGRADNMKYLSARCTDVNAGLLVDIGHLADEDDRDRVTMLFHACASGRLDMAAVLLSLNASPTRTFKVRAGIIDTLILDGVLGPFPMTALDILVTALCHTYRSIAPNNDEYTARCAAPVITDLVTASGGLTAAPPLSASIVRVAQDPLLIATRGYNIPLLMVLMSHPSFGRYAVDRNRVTDAITEANSLPAVRFGTMPVQSVSMVWRDQLRRVTGATQDWLP